MMHNLWLNEGKLTSRFVLFVHLFALSCKKKQKRIKETHSLNFHGVLTFLLTLSLYSFFGNVLILANFRKFLLVLEIKYKSIKISNKFWGSKDKILPSEWTSLLLRGKQLQYICLYFFQGFKKIMRDLKVNKTKHISR